MNFWNRKDEIKFFNESLKNFASPEQLFYSLKDGYFAYAPKGKTTEGKTLQSRNALIGQYTEKWCKDFFQPLAYKLGLFAVNNVVCPELGLTHMSNADLAFCTEHKTQQAAKNIKLIFEIKMSIVNNYSYNSNTHILKFEGDDKTHKGTPSIFRSDSILKAIGKSINIRTAGIESAKIPIIILGNNSISENYIKKIDALKQAGIIQGVISLYPALTSLRITTTPNKGFQIFDNYFLLEKFISKLVTSDIHFFSSMLSKKEIGKLITISSKEPTKIAQAEKFLQLLRENTQ